MDYQGTPGGGGGGYTNNAGTSPESNQQNKGTRKSYDEQTLIPVSIHMALGGQLDSSGDGGLMLQDGRKIASIQIVAAVRSVNAQTTNVMYELEDGTGLIEAKQWLDDNDCSALQEIRNSCMQEHKYLKVIGQIKDYEGNKVLVANSVRPLSTANELTHHMLQVVYSAEKAKRQSSIVAPPSMMMNSGIGFGFGSSAPIAQTTGGGGDSIKEQVLDFIKSNDDGSEAGVNVQQCFKMMSSHPESEIRSVIESLSEEGHVYSTISEDHYKFAH